MPTTVATDDEEYDRLPQKTNARALAGMAEAKESQNLPQKGGDAHPKPITQEGGICLQNSKGVAIRLREERQEGESGATGEFEKEIQKSKLKFI